MHTGQPDLDNPSLILSSRMILECIKLTIKTNHHVSLKLFHFVTSNKQNKACHVSPATLSVFCSVNQVLFHITAFLCHLFFSLFFPYFFSDPLLSLCMSATVVLPFEVFHKVYCHISANKSKPTESKMLSTGRGAEERVEKPVEGEPDAGRDNCRSRNRGSSQVEASFPGPQGPGDICIVQTSYL